LQLEELTTMKRTLIAKDKELAQLTERLMFKQAQYDKLESELKRLRSSESWKSISPTSSASDLSSSVSYTLIIKVFSSCGRTL
jgi:predicted RNase H-like nuclease (RuvC/YqgF family)